MRLAKISSGKDEIGCVSCVMMTPPMDCVLYKQLASWKSSYPLHSGTSVLVTSCSVYSIYRRVLTHLAYIHTVEPHYYTVLVTWHEVKKFA